MRYLSLVIFSALILMAGCSKLDRAKRAYKKGDYSKTIDLLTVYIKTNASNQEAQKYLLYAQGGLIADSAASLIKANRFEEALSLANRAVGINEKNEDARIIVDAAVKGIIAKIERDLVPNKVWSGVLNLTDEVLKHRKDDPRMNLLYAQSVYELENHKMSCKTVLALRKALPFVQNNDFLNSLLAKQEKDEQPFAAAFNKLQAAFINKDFKAWKNLATSQYLRECEIDVARLKERGDSNIRSIDDYFYAISSDPEKYGNPDGPEIVCIEVLSADRAFIHYKYRELPKVLKMEAFRGGASIKFDREQDSEIKQTL